MSEGLFRLKNNLRQSNDLDRVNIALLHDDVLDRIETISANALSFVPKRRLVSIAMAVARVEKKRVPGVFVEAGCARGGAAGLIAHMMRQDRALHLYDVFEKIPPPDAVDGEKARALFDDLDTADAETIKKYMDHMTSEDPLELTRQIIVSIAGAAKSSCFRFHQGLVQDTLKIDDPVAFAHIDLDWYDPTLCTLNAIMPRTVVGSIVIVDDVYFWPGCAAAVEEYFSDRADAFVFDSTHGHLIAERIQT